jgi:hypothetical protein
MFLASGSHVTLPYDAHESRGSKAVPRLTGPLTVLGAGWDQVTNFAATCREVSLPNASLRSPLRTKSRRFRRLAFQAYWCGLCSRAVLQTSSGRKRLQQSWRFPRPAFTSVGNHGGRLSGGPGPAEPTPLSTQHECWAQGRVSRPIQAPRRTAEGETLMDAKTGSAFVATGPTRAPRVTAPVPPPAQVTSRFVGTLAFQAGYPTIATVQRLYAEPNFQQALGRQDVSAGSSSRDPGERVLVGGDLRRVDAIDVGERPGVSEQELARSRAAAECGRLGGCVLRP